MRHNPQCIEWNKKVSEAFIIIKQDVKFKRLKVHIEGYIALKSSASFSAYTKFSIQEQKKHLTLKLNAISVQHIL